MNFSPDEDHLALKQSAAAFLDKEIALDPLLKPGASVAQANYRLHWEKIVAMGWTGIAVPESYGGLGLSCVDVAMVLGEMGRTLAPSPFLGNLIGTWALLKLGTEEQKRRILPAVAAGTARLALAVGDAAGDDHSREVSAEPGTSGFLLKGTRDFAIDADGADWLIVDAHNTETGRRGFFLVDTKSDGLDIDVMDWRDLTRQVCDVRLNGCIGEPMAPFAPADWSWVRDRILFALAAECAAGAQQILSMTADYAKERVAFGKSIGSYQAIKHSLADMLGQAECANVAVADRLDLDHFRAAIGQQSCAPGPGDERGKIHDPDAVERTQIGQCHVHAAACCARSITRERWARELPNSSALAWARFK